MTDLDLNDLEAIDHFLVVARHQGTWLAGVLCKEDALRFTGQDTVCPGDRQPTQPNKGRDR